VLRLSNLNCEPGEGYTDPAATERTRLLPAELTAGAEPAQDHGAPDAGAWVAVRGAGWEPGETVRLTMVGISYKEGPFPVGEAHPEGGAGAFQTAFFTRAQPVAREQWTNITLLAEGGGERAQAPIPFFAFYVAP
jgi:hypothetical protein